MSVSHYWLFQDLGILGGTGDTSLLAGQDSRRETGEQDGAGSDEDSAAPAWLGALSGIRVSTITQPYLAYNGNRSSSSLPPTFYVSRKLSPILLVLSSFHHSLGY